MIIIFHRAKNAITFVKHLTWDIWNYPNVKIFPFTEKHMLRDLCVCEGERTWATINFNLLQMFQYIFRNRTEQNENVHLKIEYNVLKIL